MLLPDGTQIGYLVDGKGRRAGKSINGVLLKQWLYRDTLKPVAELDGSGSLVARYVYGSHFNVPDFVVKAGKTYRVIGDHLGSPQVAVNIADPSDVPFSADYDAWGNVTGTGLDWMPFGFAGGVYDGDTGLVRFGARDYDPRIGRWVRKDPLRFGGGQNLYAYAKLDPANWVDIDGLTCILPEFLQQPVSNGVLPSIAALATGMWADWN